jgi:RHS repeat-associated protein
MTISTRYFCPQSPRPEGASRFVTLKLRRAAFISVAIFLLLFTILGSAKAQNPIHGSTSASQAPGSPSGSYGLTGFENVNLFNGHLNFHLPLLSINGRGESGYTITLPIESRWVAEGTIGMGGFGPSFNWWTGIKPGYSPGVLQGRQIGEPCNWDLLGTTTSTATRLTFTSADGTEYELLDTQYGGEAALSYCLSANPPNPGASRGTTFVSIDGSSATFISDAPIVDNPRAGDGALLIYPSGNLLFANGTRYRISNGRVSEIRDRNGNTVSLEYEHQDFTARVVSIKDSLERQVNITYASGSVTFDQITFKGFDGAERSIRIERTNLMNALIAGESISSYPALFPELTSSPANIHNPEVVASVTLPNQKTYQFKYNRYAELARVELPTGGLHEYDWGSGYLSGHPSGTNGGESQIIRRVIERREYSDSTTLVGKTTFGKLIPAGSPETEGSVLVRSFTPNGELLAQDKHYFKIVISGGDPLFAIPPPLDGREFKTEILLLDGSVLRTTTHNWVTAGTLVSTPTNPRITETATTLNDANLVSKQTFLYDGFNNRTDTYEFDFGVGSAGARRRHTRVTYLNSSSYTGANVHIRDRVTQISVFDGPDGAEKERSRTVFEYDDYSNTANHALLRNWQDVTGIPMTGHDSALGTSYLTRGNVTKTTQFLLVADPTTNPAQAVGWVSIYNQYDLAGNIVKTIDALGNPYEFEYLDRFGSPDGNAQSNTGPSHLNSPTLKYTYAFPTKVTNAIGQFGFTQFDYYIGTPVDVEDINGVVSSSSYGDPLDRPTQVILANNQAASVRTQINFTYDDTARTITKKSDKDAFNDGLLMTQTLYDGLGRTIEQRTYETVSNFIAIETQYDALGRPFKTSSPFRQSEYQLWTTQAFDPLGRVVSVTTPDNSVVTTSYSGNTVAVTDQAGKRRKSVTDALGRLIEVYEDPQIPGGPTELDYQTGYSYDTLDNLVKVAQGSQQRFFMYDSLKRLIRSRIPEQGTLASLSLSDTTTGNSAWSTGYEYDSNGNLTQKTDARGVSSTYVYDALNRNTTIDYSDTTGISPDVTRLYDGALKGKGRLWKSYAGGTESNGSSVERTVVDSYDALGRPLVLNQSFKVNNVWKPPYQTTRAYNLAGAVTSQIYPSGYSVTYNYDNAGRLGDKDALNPAFKGNLGEGGAPRTYSQGIIYASSGQLTQEQFGTTTPIYNKLFYNSRQQLAEILVSTTVGNTWDRGKILNQYSLQCSGASCNATDNNGNLRKQEVFIPNINPQLSPTSWYQQYDYDELNRLKRVHEYTGNTALDWQQEFDYDRWGNRIINATNTWIGNSGNPPSPLMNETQFDTSVFESTNRLQAPGDQTQAQNQRLMRYDNAGNLTNDTYTGSGERVYDAENRMIKAWGGDNQWQFYTYNADGQRTRRKINNQETWDVYGFDGELLAEYPAEGATNNPTKEYGYRNGQLLVTAEPVTAAPVNVALASNGATATSSTSFSGFAASGAINGDRKGLFGWQDGYWSTGSAGFPAWLEVQFNGSKTITEIDVVTLQDNYNAPIEPTESTTFTQYGLTAYQVQYWNGSAWTTISDGTVSGNNKIWKKFSFAPITTTKIRVLSSASPDNYSRLTEVEAWTGPSPAPRYNLALGATATASSNWTGWPPSSCVNGDRKSLNPGTNGGWVDAAPANTFPDWLQVDFGTNRTINEVDVFTLQDNYAGSSEPTQSMTFTQWGLTAYTVDYWDGSNWIQIPQASVSGNNKIWRKFEFSPISTSKIRVVTSASVDGYSRLTEVEAYGPPDTGGSGGIQWLVSDHLGTPRMILDQTGNLANMTRHDYLPFGEELHSPQGLRTEALGYSGVNGVRQEFTSKERDLETGLDYFLARYYSSSQGRFTSTDEFKGGPDELYTFVDNASANPSFYADLTNPQSLNKYQYAYNNPVRFIDPDGHEPTPDPQDPCGCKLTAKQLGELQRDLEKLDEATSKPLYPITDLIGTSTPPSIDPIRIPPLLPQPLPSKSSPASTTQTPTASATRPKNNAQPLPPPPPMSANNRRTLNVIVGQMGTAVNHVAKILASNPNDPNRNHWKKEAKAAIDRMDRLAGRLPNTMRRAIREIVSQLRDAINKN